jgi:hypothetical protein
MTTVVDPQARWIAFVQGLPGQYDWQSLLLSASWAKKSIGEAFLVILVQSAMDKGPSITARERHSGLHAGVQQLLQEVCRQISGSGGRTHYRTFAQGFMTSHEGLRREPKKKPCMGPELFVYLN